MTDTNTPYADFDRYALEIARGLAQIDRNRLRGGTEQFVAVLQAALVDAMIRAYTHINSV